MPGKISASSGAIRSVGTKLTGASAEAERLLKSMQSLTNRLAVTWHGHGGAQFQQTQARLLPDLRRAEVDLKQAADSLFDAAAEYEKFEVAVNRNVTRLRAETGRPALTVNGMDAPKRPDARVFAPLPHEASGANLNPHPGPGAADAAMLGTGSLGGSGGQQHVEDAVTTIARAWSEAAEVVSVDGWSGGAIPHAADLLSKGASSLNLGGGLPESSLVHHDLESLHQAIAQYGRQSSQAHAAAVTLCHHVQQLHQSLAGRIPGLSAVLPVPTFHA